MSNTCSGCSATWTATNAAHCGTCHRTFAAVSLFDLHRCADDEHGTCLDPVAVVNRKTGARLMEFRNGMWRGPEMTAEQKAALYGNHNEDSTERAA